MFNINNANGGTFNGFDSFAEYEEGLEQAALNILANEKAEIVHISDNELNKMADNIIHHEDVVIPQIKKENRQTTLLTLGAYALMIGWGAICINFFSGSFDPKPQQPEQCTILPDGDCQ